MNKKIYIFDFDGVIADSSDLAYSIHNDIASKYGLKFIKNQNEYLDIIDNSNLKKVLSDEFINKYYDESNNYYKKRISSIKLYPHMHKLFENSMRIVIITSTYEEFVYSILKNNGITSDVVVLGKSLESSKVKRFEIFMNENKCDKDNIIYIGDTISDYLFCEKCNIKMIGSNYGYSNLEKIKTKLLRLCNSDKELYDYIMENS